MDRYPYAIVWTPLPIISWLIPVIGHTGIATSEGVIYDFGGSHYIAVDNMTFGRPTKYLTLEPAKAQGRHWDNAIQVSSGKFRQRTHNLIMNNCHDHVADALNEMKYDGRSNYNSFDVFLMMTLHSEYVSFAGFLYQWGVFVVLLFTIVIMCILGLSW